MSTVEEPRVRLSAPQRVAEKAAKIYAEIDDDIKLENKGRYMAVEVESGQHFIEDFSHQALRSAREAHPTGMIHVLRIGAEDTFKVSYAGHGEDLAWPLR